MKLGFGLYRHMLNESYYAFAKQCGATHVVVHLVDYFNQGKGSLRGDQPVGGSSGWGLSEQRELWSVEYLRSIKNDLNEHGLEWSAIENFEPVWWHDILLDGPKKEQQIEDIKTVIRNVGQVGIPMIGYNFSISGVSGRLKRKVARGNAETVVVESEHELVHEPIPKGMVWNMVYDPHAEQGFLEPISNDELWDRVAYFLQAVLPVAEEAGVVLAAHPDDPPLARVRQQPKLIIQHDLCQRLLDIMPSPSNQLEFCIGTLAEMSEGDIYQCIDRYTRQGQVAYIHMRNVVGQVPHYVESFIDDGKLDIRKIFSILEKNHFTGVIIPDHAPQMSCDSPWHAGMAFAMGYLRAQMQMLG